MWLCALMKNLMWACQPEPLKSKKMEHMLQIKHKILEVSLILYFLKAQHITDDLRFFAFYKFQTHTFNFMDVNSKSQIGNFLDL